jgi:hypothetical protein
VKASLHFILNIVLARVAGLADMGSSKPWLEQSIELIKGGLASDICEHEKVTRHDASSRRHSTARRCDLVTGTTSRVTVTSR